MSTAPSIGMLERSLALFPGWQLGRQAQQSRVDRRDFAGAIASVKRATLGELELDVLSWLTARWWEQGAPRDGITRFTWYGLGHDLWATGPGWTPGGRHHRMLQEAVDNLLGAIVTLTNVNVHTGQTVPALFSDVHVLRSVVRQAPSPARAAGGEGGLRQDTVEVCLEDWLVAQLRGDCLALLDWQVQRQLGGLAKRLWCYLAGRGPDFAPAAWSTGHEVLIVPLDADVYAGWSLNGARERNDRARVLAAAARIVEADPRYVAITVKQRDDRCAYELCATRHIVEPPEPPAVPAPRSVSAHGLSSEGLGGGFDGAVGDLDGDAVAELVAQGGGMVDEAQLPRVGSWPPSTWRWISSGGVVRRSARCVTWVWRSRRPRRRSSAASGRPGWC